MNRWLPALCSGLVCLSTSAQTPKIKWGEEFKLRKGSTDLEVMFADKSGVYLQETHQALKSYFVIGYSTRTSAMLIKMDKNLSEIYRNDFNRELKGKEFEQFFMLQDKLFLVATEYSKPEKTLTLFAAPINKSSGELDGGWQTLTSFQKEEKKDEIRCRLSLSADSSHLVVVSSVEGKERNQYTVQKFDNSLKANTTPILISNEFEPRTFQLEDVLYTSSNTILLVGRRFEFQEGKKKKDKFLDFVQYNIRVYDEKGKQRADINTDVDGKWLMSTKVVQEKNKDLVLAAFYSNQKKGRTIDGMLVQRIEPVSGQVVATHQKTINMSLLTNDPDNDEGEGDDETETKAERKERQRLDKMKDEGEGFSRRMQFRNIFYTSDNGLVLLAEKYHHYIITTVQTSGGMGPGAMMTTHEDVYSISECGDLLMCKIDSAGNIGWLESLPKSQREVMQIGYVPNGLWIGSYFDDSRAPFYAGIGALQSGSSINVFFNDNPKNALITQPVQKPKLIRRFSKSDCFILSIDPITGKYTRKPFFSNTDVPTAMPRLGSVIADDMYMVGKDDRVFAKTKLAVARITVK